MMTGVFLKISGIIWFEEIVDKIDMKKSKDKLPTFKNLREVADFWDTHEFTEFAHEFTRAKTAEIELRKRTYLPVTLEMYEKLEHIATARGISVDVLIKQWVEEKLAEY